MTYNGGRDIAFHMVEACQEFIESCVRIAWDGGFDCHEFHGAVEMLFDELATTWDAYWQRWAEAAEEAYNDQRLAELRIKTLQDKDIADPEVDKARHKAIREIRSITAQHRKMLGERLSDDARLILDRWLDDIRQKEGE